MSKFVVPVDPDLSDLIPGFLARKRQDAEAIRAAADAQDYATLSSLGHKIKGEGGSYGLDGISTIGEQVELAAKQQDLQAIRQLADNLIDYLDSVEIVFE